MVLLRACYWSSSMLRKQIALGPWSRHARHVPQSSPQSWPSVTALDTALPEPAWQWSLSLSGSSSGRVIRSRWAQALSLTSVERWEKTLSLVGFSQTFSGGAESCWSTHFLSLPFPGMLQQNPAKTNQTYSGFWTGFGLHHCGNSAWFVSKGVRYGGGGRAFYVNRFQEF